MSSLNPLEQELIDAMVARCPDVACCVPAVVALHEALVQCYDQGGTLFTCGNGGSNADAIHIVGELCKSFERKRPLDAAFAEKLRSLPLGEELVQHLEAGLAAVTLGQNSALKTATENDSQLANLAFAQEANALVKPGDLLLGVSTSGNANNCLMAMSVAKAKGATLAVLTGPKGGKMAEFADIAIKSPGEDTKHVQEYHIALYHTLCSMIEAHYFPELRG